MKKVIYCLGAIALVAGLVGDANGLKSFPAGGQMVDGPRNESRSYDAKTKQTIVTNHNTAISHTEKDYDALREEKEAYKDDAAKWKSKSEGFEKDLGDEREDRIKEAESNVEFLAVEREFDAMLESLKGYLGDEHAVDEYTMLGETMAAWNPDGTPGAAVVGIAEGVGLAGAAKDGQVKQLAVLVGFADNAWCRIVKNACDVIFGNDYASLSGAYAWVPVLKETDREALCAAISADAGWEAMAAAAAAAVGGGGAAAAAAGEKVRAENVKIKREICAAIRASQNESDMCAAVCRVAARYGHALDAYYGVALFQGVKFIGAAAGGANGQGAIANVGQLKKAVQGQVLSTVLDVTQYCGDRGRGVAWHADCDLDTNDHITHAVSSQLRAFGNMCRQMEERDFGAFNVSKDLLWLSHQNNAAAGVDNYERLIADLVINNGDGAGVAKNIVSIFKDQHAGLVEKVATVCSSIATAIDKVLDQDEVKKRAYTQADYEHDENVKVRETLYDKVKESFEKDWDATWGQVYSGSDKVELFNFIRAYITGASSARDNLKGIGSNPDVRVAAGIQQMADNGQAIGGSLTLVNQANVIAAETATLGKELKNIAFLASVYKALGDFAEKSKTAIDEKAVEARTAGTTAATVAGAGNVNANNRTVAGGVVEREFLGRTLAVLVNNGGWAKDFTWNAEAGQGANGVGTGGVEVPSWIAHVDDVLGAKFPVWSSIACQENLNAYIPVPQVYKKNVMNLCIKIGKSLLGIK